MVNKIENAQPTITAISSAFPSAVNQTELWEGFFKRHFNDDAFARRLFKSIGVQQRHAVVNPLVEDVTNWTTGKRMERYEQEAFPLAVQAVETALKDAAISPEDIGLLAVVSCTGYASPGLDILVPASLGMSQDVRRLVVGHMGCYASLPALSAVGDYVKVHDKPAVMLSIELSSLHVQAPTMDTEQMVAHALFSDAASAVIVEAGANCNQRQGFEIVDVATLIDFGSADLMTWHITDQGFRMGLSVKIPDVLENNVVGLVDNLLNKWSLTIDDIPVWAVHPGGPRIVDVVQERLKLKDVQLAESRAVLANHGNCSSVTVLVVLDEISNRADLKSGDNVVALAFGPGLTLYATLLKVV